MTMMISKFHRIIQSKIVWGAFAIIVCVAFVGITAPGARGRNAASAQRHARRAGRLFGEDVSRAEFNQAYRHVVVGYILASGRPIQITDEMQKALQQAAWERLAILKKAKQLDITASPEQVVRLIQSQRLFQNPKTGQFDKQMYDYIVASLLPNYGMTERDLEGMFAEQAIIEKISLMPAQGALVQETEIRQMFHLYTDELTVEYANIPRSLVPTPALTEDDYKAFYETHKEDFRVPERTVVKYVEFAVSDYSNEVTVSDDEVTRYYESNKQQFQKPTVDNNAEPEYKSLTEVKEEIVKTIREGKARQIASDKADELVVSLANESMSFDEAVKKENLKIAGQTKPFSATDPVDGIDPTAPFQKAAFALEQDETHYYSDPVVGKDFVYVLSLVERKPSYIPSFKEARAQVVAAAKIAAQDDAYAKKTDEIQKAVAQAVKNGTSFKDAIAKYKLESKQMEPFKLTSPIQDITEQQIARTAVRYAQGKVTSLVSTPAGSAVAYVSKRVPANEETELPAMRDQILSNLVRSRAALMLSAWRSDLLKEADFENLLNRPKDQADS